MDNIKRKTWKIWEKNPKVEERTFKRVKKILPEMESTKQLVNILKPIYKKNMKILDVGCAAGHYYLGLMKLDDQICTYYHVLFCVIQPMFATYYNF